MGIVLDKISNYNYNEVYQSFSKDFIGSINGPYPEQKLLKYSFLRNYFNIHDENQLKIISKNYCYNGEFFSSSYSGDYIFFMIDKKKIGIDIELIKSRESMIDFFPKTYYDILGLGKNGVAFYFLWTAGEALLKALNLRCFEEIRNFKLISSNNKEKKIGKISFLKILNFEYNNKEYSVYVGKLNDVVYSVCML